MTREEEPQPGLFEKVVEALRRLAESPANEVPPLLVSAELKVLAELGFAPALTECASCGRPPGPGRIAVSVAVGGLLCTDCRERDPKAPAVPAGRLAALRSLAETPLARAGRVRLAPADIGAIRSFLTSFTEWRLERRLRTARFL